MTTKRFQIVFISSEVSPWSQTGGLGQVVGGLTTYLGRMGHRVMCISPRWDQYSDAWDTSTKLTVELNGKEEEVGFFHTFKNNVDYVFVDHPLFLECVHGLTQMKYYGPETGVNWDNNQLKFSLLAKSTLKAILNLHLGGFPYGENCAIICNDWHTALIPALIFEEKKKNLFLNTKVFLCIHNIVFQGRFELNKYQQDMYGFSNEVFEKYICKQTIEVGSKLPQTMIINWMKGGIYFADKILTVSKSFADEILNCPSKGIELNEDIKTKGIIGILNGLKDLISPMNEKFCIDLNIQRFGIDEIDSVKCKVKKIFQNQIGLPTENIPLFIFLGRFDLQKGCDVFFEVVRRMFGVIGNYHDSNVSTGVNTPVNETTKGNSMNEIDKFQIVMVGSGVKSFISQADELQMLFPKQFIATSFIKGPLKYYSLIASDFLVAPSRFEPCGLVQMEAMRFGCLPICTPTGGFKDTVVNGVSGIHLDKEIELESVVSNESVQLLMKAMKIGIDLYNNDSEKLSEMRKTAFSKSHTFRLSETAKNYCEMLNNSGIIDISKFKSINESLSLLSYQDESL